MIKEEIKKQVITIWDDYISANMPVLDTKGNAIDNIDEERIRAIEEIKVIIYEFLKANLNISEFKTSLDSYNKRNNLWGFTATKGQMFFNQLTKTNENNLDNLTVLVKESIIEPKGLEGALAKIEKFEKFTANIFNKAKDKRKAPNPGSIGYFLSYFWQIHNNREWPIIYTSLISAYKELGIWTEQSSQKEIYSYFFSLNEEIKSILTQHSKKEVTNWDAEHSFWNYTGNPNTVTKRERNEKTVKVELAKEDVVPQELKLKANFEITDYLIPKVAKLVELGNQTDLSASAKGSEYEKLVSEIFKQLDFEVEALGQGSGRNPDAIIKFREENTAFIVDAKAYSSGYSLGIDDRAMKEYIGHYCPKLNREGYKKIGFIIVSNSFKSNFDSFINDITWNSDIKRFVLLTSEALLYLLAYKTKDKLPLSRIIESIIGFGNLVTAQNVIDEFDDY